MLERYALEPVKSIWTLEAQYERWLEVELGVVEAYEECGYFPTGTSRRMRNKIILNVKRILEYEKTTEHDVIAFIKAITENLGKESRYFHYGLTSSDVVDTAYSLALKRALEIIIKDAEDLYSSLLELAQKHRNTVIIGRTHGIHAEPTSFGLKVLSWAWELERNIQRLKFAKDEISIGKISGAVGNYANVDPEVEKIALSKLGLKPEKVATQVIPRDRHSFMLSVLALVGGCVERIALEIRHLQRTEVSELQEPFKEGQRGSSAMPHKKNPILSERLCGMARLLRSYANASYENIALWHERDISHSSVERHIFPDATSITHYMLVKMKYIIDNLVVYEEKMRKNLEMTKGLIFSQRVMLKLIEKGLSREKAYEMVMKSANLAHRNSVDFKKVLINDPEISKYLTEEEMEGLFDCSYYLRNVDEIFKRFGL